MGKLFSIDSLYNLITGLGTSKDKSTHSSYMLNILSKEQLTTAYRGDWIARKVVNCPAEDSTREWREWQADESDIEKLENAEKQFDLQRKLKRALIKARLFGGSALVMGVDGTGSPEEELVMERVKEGALKYVHVVSRYEIAIGSLITDVTSDLYGEPEYYTVSSQSMPGLKIHPSRVVRLVGQELPELSESDGWGDSSLQAVDDAIKNVGLCSGGIATLVWEAKIDVIKIPELMSSLATDEYKTRLIERFTLANQAKSMVNALLLDKEEDWSRMTQSFTGLPDVLRLYLQIASGAADIPATRLLGQAPQGQNATGDSDTRNYYDMIRSNQKNELSPTLQRLDEVFIRSTLGDYNPEIHYDWRPLWQMDEKERASINLTQAQAHKIDVDNALILEDALAQGRINQLIESGFYPGFESAIDDAKAIAEEVLNEDDPDVIAQAKISMGVEPAVPNVPTPGALGPDGKPVIAPGKLPGPSVPPIKPPTKDYSPDQPRGPDGRFGEGGSQNEAHHHEPLGKGYSTDARLVNGVIHTGNVYDAVLALSQDRPVELTQPKQVSTLIKALGDVTKTMVEAGGKVPSFDLCKVTVAGTNLFCADNKGIPRIQMPQMDDKQTKVFVKSLKEMGYGVEKDTEKSANLRATQAQLDAAKVNKFYERIRNDKNFKGDDKRLVISRDNYVLDGHHHWAAQVAADAMDNKLGDHKTKVFRVDIDIIPLYKLAMKHTGGVGGKGMGDWNAAIVDCYSDDGGSGNRQSDVSDASPRSLYVRRDVVNANEIKVWAREQGFATSLDDMHVTIIYPKTPVDWIKMGEPVGSWEPYALGDDEVPEGGLYIKPGGPRAVEVFGQDAVVLQFASSALSYRNCQMRNLGCSFDYQEYVPHITITYDPNVAELVSIVVPYRGAIVLGPEIFEEINHAGISEDRKSFPFDYSPDQPREPDGKFAGEGSEHGNTKENVGSFLSGNKAREALGSVVSALKDKEVQKTALASAINFCMYHVAGADYGADIDRAIHHEVQNFATNAKITKAVAWNMFRKGVDKLVTLRRGTKDGDVITDRDDVLERLLKLQKYFDHHVDPDDDYGDDNEDDFNEVDDSTNDYSPDQPRDPDGRFGEGSGNENQPRPPNAEGIRGSAVEREGLRAQLKAETDTRKRDQIKEQIVKSFYQGRENARENGNLKRVEMLTKKIEGIEKKYSISGQQQSQQPQTMTTPIITPSARDTWVNYSSTTSQKFKDEVAGALNKMSDQTINTMVNAGIKFETPEKLIDIKPELKNVKPRGWTSGTTWEMAEGLYSNGKREIVTAQKMANSMGVYSDSPRVAGVVLHESGHAYDDALGRPSANSSEFHDAYTKDREEVDKMSFNTRLDLQYFRQAGDAGKSEAFAEIFANHHGGGTTDTVTSYRGLDGKETKRLEPGISVANHFPRTSALVKKYINQGHT